MAEIVNERPSDFRANLEAMAESELLAQQIVQRGAQHAIEFLLANGCSRKTAQEMLRNIKTNMKTIEEVVADKGFKQLFGGTS